MLVALSLQRCSVGNKIAGWFSHGAMSAATFHVSILVFPNSRVYFELLVSVPLTLIPMLSRRRLLAARYAGAITSGAIGSTEHSARTVSMGGPSGSVMTIALAKPRVSCSVPILDRSIIDFARSRHNKWMDATLRIFTDQLRTLNANAAGGSVFRSRHEASPRIPTTAAPQKKRRAPEQVMPTYR
jgi:hypothetical protein